AEYGFRGGLRCHQSTVPVRSLSSSRAKAVSQEFISGGKTPYTLRRAGSKGSAEVRTGGKGSASTTSVYRAKASENAWCNAWGRKARILAKPARTASGSSAALQPRRRYSSA